VGIITDADQVSAVTGACLMVSKEKYLAVNGLNEKDLAITFNDVDFCLRLIEQGYRNIFTPYAELYHRESLSRGKNDSIEKQKNSKAEANYIRQRHSHYFTNGDPFYHKNISKNPSFFGLDAKPE
jgi:GT2 family glycosyltransferase